MKYLKKISLFEIPVDEVREWTLFQTTVQQEDDAVEDKDGLQETWRTTPFACSLCEVELFSSIEQREHHASRLHRINGRRRVKGRSPLPPDLCIDDVESDECLFSTSEDSASEDALPVDSVSQDATIFPSGCYFLRKDHLLSLNKALIYSKKKDNYIDAMSSLRRVIESRWWIFLMCQGGYFAGAVYDRQQIVAHKTLHRYVTRKGQGGTQSAHDKKGQSAHSAGATLRRHNEAHFEREVHSLLSKWNHFLEAADFIFLSAPSHNRKIFDAFNAKMFKMNDRVRQIPLTTYRPCFLEIQRIFSIMSFASIYTCDTCFFRQNDTLLSP